MTTELTPTRSGVAAEHSNLISGLEKLYGTFIDCGYVQNTDVQVPPHGIPKDPVDVVGLRQGDLDPDAIELIGKLPCFTNDITARYQKKTRSPLGIPIAENCAAVSYLIGSGHYQKRRQIDDNDTELLSSRTVRLTEAIGQDGLNAAYDMDTKHIISWHPGGWHDRKYCSVEEVCDSWCANLLAADWKPMKI